MSASITTSSSVTVFDPVQNINFQQSKAVTDTTTGLTVVMETYNLAASDTDFRMITKGDIGTIQDVHLIVTKKANPTTFAGVSVAFDVDGSGPTDGIFTVKDSLVITGEIDDTIYLWVKNLDTSACTLTVVLGGTNFSDED